jgi:hypothetical protein
MRRAVLILVGLGLLAALPSSSFGDIWLADYHGYDYTWPLSEDFTTEGQFYAALGPVISMNEDYFILDEDTFEYTIHIQSGTLTSSDTVGTYVFYHYEEEDGTISFYEDSRTTGSGSDYGTYPPNETAPSTFIDGTHMLGGCLTSLTIVIEQENGDGTFSGMIDFDEGDYLENIPPNMREGWTFSALGLGHPPFTPEGYMNQIDGEVYLEGGTPVKSTTWGRIRILYIDE